MSRTYKKHIKKNKDHNKIIPYGMDYILEEEYNNKKVTKNLTKKTSNRMKIKKDLKRYL